MPILPADQTFSRVGPVRLLFPEIRFKGHCRRAPHGLLFSILSYKCVLERQCFGGFGQRLPSLLPRPLIPSVPLRGFLRREKQGKFERQLNRRGNCVLGASVGLACGGSRAGAWRSLCSGESGPQLPACLRRGHGAGQEGRPPCRGMPLMSPVLLRNRGTMGTSRSRPVSGGPEKLAV